MKSSRFAIAVHILVLLAIEGDEPLTSEYLARSANTNPVVIRRLFGPLREAGLVIARSGTGGGTSLARAPEQITLLDIHLAIGEKELFSLGAREQNPYCICGRSLSPVLASVFSRAEAAIEQTFAETTVAQLAQEVQERDTHST